MLRASSAHVIHYDNACIHNSARHHDSAAHHDRIGHQWSPYHVNTCHDGILYTGHNDRTACSAWSMVFMYWTGHRDTVGQTIVLILHGYHAGSD